MKQMILLILLLTFAPSALAEKMSCNVEGGSLFSLIDLDTTSKEVVMTDSFGRETHGKIGLVRDAGNGKSKINVSFEYKLNDMTTYFDMIIVPVADEEYSVGMAGYIRQDRKNTLELASKNKAMCF